jgi:hypothetical protein
MKRLLVVAAFLCLSSGLAWAGAPEGATTSIGLEGGTNFIGASAALRLSKKIQGPFWGSFILEQTSFSFVSKAGSGYLGFINPTGKDVTLNVDIHSIFTLEGVYRRTEEGTFRLLDSVGLGISQFDLTIHEAFSASPSQPLKGEKSLSALAVFTEVHLLDFHPPEGEFDFFLGVKAQTAFIPGPLTVYMENGYGQIQAAVQYGKKGEPLIFPYPELFLGTTYSFN